jgi:hypothetical protein
VNTQTPSAGTVTNDMLAGSIANSKLANSSITLNGSAVSLGGSATVGGDNTPMWYVRRTSDQTLNENVYTKIEWNTENIDTDSAFDNSTNYRFTVPSGKAGKYYLSTGVGFFDCSAQEHHYVLFYKNGSNVSADPSGITTVSDDTDRYWQTNNMIVDLGVGDYVEVYGLFSSASGDTTSTVNYSYFTGYKLIT